MKTALVAATALVIGALGGCANLTPPARQHALSEKGVHWIEYDASRRGATMSVMADGTFRGCAEPAPDIGLSMVSKLSANLAGANQAKTDLSAEFSATALELAGRTQLVLVLRESLYRICEASMNTQMSAEQIKSLFESTLKTAETIAAADRDEASTRKTKAETKHIQAQMLQDRMLLK